MKTVEASSLMRIHLTGAFTNAQLREARGRVVVALCGTGHQLTDAPDGELFSFEQYRTTLNLLDNIDLLLVIVGGDPVVQNRVAWEVGYASARGVPIFIYAPVEGTRLHVAFVHPALGVAQDLPSLLQAVPELGKLRRLSVTTEFAEAVAEFQSRWKRIEV